MKYLGSNFPTVKKTKQVEKFTQAEKANLHYQKYEGDL